MGKGPLWTQPFSNEQLIKNIGDIFFKLKTLHFQLLTDSIVHLYIATCVTIAVYRVGYGCYNVLYASESRLSPLVA